MHDTNSGYAIEWQDLDTDTVPTAPANLGDTLELSRWHGSALQAGMQSIYERLGRLAATLAKAPPEIRVDYAMPSNAGVLHGLVQGEYELTADDALHTSFCFRFCCTGKQRFTLRADSRPARDEYARWLAARGLSYHVEDAYGSQWHYSLIVKPRVPVSLQFEADIEQSVMRVVLSNLDELETLHRSVRADAITPILPVQLERLILRRPHRLDEFTGDRVEGEVRARFRAAIDERRRSRVEELGEPGEPVPAAGLGGLKRLLGARSSDTARSCTAGPATTASPVFIGPRDDEGALEWNGGAQAAEVAAPPPGAHMPPSYAWLITASNIEDTAANRGKLGPRGASRLFPVRQVLMDGREFRLRDHDGHIAFTGRIVGVFGGYEPVKDYGLDHGCLRIEYRHGDHWTELRPKES